MNKRVIIRSVEDLIDLAGGYNELVRITGASFWNVAKWKSQGIPRKYWGPLVDNLNISVAEVFAIDEAIRRANGK